MDAFPSRRAEIRRQTSETNIQLTLVLDGEGRADAKSGIPFFDHMLTALARHALFDLDLECHGDLEVDFHHTVEDCGLALGQAFSKALGDKVGIRRFGHAFAPMDEALARVAIDIGGRQFLVYRVESVLSHAGTFPIQLVEEFCRAFSANAGLNLHIELLYGRDPHHIAEAIFKGLAKSLDAACQRDPRVRSVPSTKGVIF